MLIRFLQKMTFSNHKLQENGNEFSRTFLCHFPLCHSNAFFVYVYYSENLTYFDGFVVRLELHWI